MTAKTRRALGAALFDQALLLAGGALYTGATILTWPAMAGGLMVLVICWLMTALWVGLSYQRHQLHEDQRERAYQQGRIDLDLEVTAELRRVISTEDQK